MAVCRSAERARCASWLAVVTVIAFLFRHDHGAFVGLATAVLMLSITELRFAERVRHVVIYGLLVARAGGAVPRVHSDQRRVVSYFRQASAWAERDRAREPVVWPGLFDNPDGVSDEAKAGSLVANGAGQRRGVGVLHRDPAAVLRAVRAGRVPRRLQARVAARDAKSWRWWRCSALALDAGFLRSPLEARLADPSVPLVILVAWLMVAVPRMLQTTRRCGRRWLPYRWPMQVAVDGRRGVAIALLFVVLVNGDLYKRLDKASMTERFGKPFERAGDHLESAARSIGTSGSWAARPERPDLITLSLYINACTAPADRVLVQSYLPQVLAMARRAFAGGHADLRPGFFEIEEAQRLTLERLRAASRCRSSCSIPTIRCAASTARSRS